MDVLVVPTCKYYDKALELQPSTVPETKMVRTLPNEKCYTTCIGATFEQAARGRGALRFE